MNNKKMNQNNSLTVSIFFHNKLSNNGTRLPLINEKIYPYTQILTALV